MIRFAAACLALSLAASPALAQSDSGDSGDTDTDTEVGGIADGAAQLAGDEGGPAACGCAAGSAAVAWLPLLVVGLSTRRIRRPRGPAGA